MVNSDLPIYLVSRSPRRRKLLKQLNIKFNSYSVNVEERFKRGEKPWLSVKRLANEKLTKARKKIENGIIITADTIVVLDNKIIGKPKDKKDAKRILRKLSGRIHTVYTGFSICNSKTGETLNDYEKTNVEFRKLTDIEINEYIETGSPMDKAGAYGIQDDFGAVFIKKINGCYYNVVGLPLAKVYKALMKIT